MSLSESNTDHETVHKKKRKKIPKSERKRRKRAREEAERRASLDNTVLSSSPLFITPASITPAEKESKSSDSSFNTLGIKDVRQLTGPIQNLISIEKPISDDPYTFSKLDTSGSNPNPKPTTAVASLFSKENLAPIKHIQFVYEKGFKSSDKQVSLDPVPYVHTKLRKKDEINSAPGSIVGSVPFIEDNDHDHYMKKLQEHSIDEILNPNLKKEISHKKSTDPPSFLSEMEKKESATKSTLKKIESNPSDFLNQKPFVRIDVQEELTMEGEKEMESPSLQRRQRSNSLSDPNNCKLSGRTVEDAIKDHSGRRPRCNSTDGELNLPKRGLCDERVVLRMYKWDLDLFKPSPPRGFHNLGNTCFLNATLQCLSHLPVFCQSIAMLSAGNNQSHTKRSNGELFILFLRSLLRKVHGLDGEAKSHPYAPKLIVRNISLLGGLNRGYKFRPGRQEDAHEFLVHLLECIHDGELKAAGE